jgi:hypothetical protein
MYHILRKYVQWELDGRTGKHEEATTSRFLQCRERA